jgi:hypothetical protein
MYHYPLTIAPDQTDKEVVYEKVTAVLKQRIPARDSGRQHKVIMADKKERRPCPLRTWIMLVFVITTGTEPH